MSKVEQPRFHDNMTAAEISAALDALELPGRSEEFAAEGVVTATRCSEPELLARAAIRFALRLPAGRDVREVLSELLGAEQGERLIAAWAERGVTINGPVPEVCGFVFFPSSNNRTRARQDADFERAGLAGLADDLEATLVCAALVQKARDAGIDLSDSSVNWPSTAKLADEELDLLTKLRHGMVRTLSGALCVQSGGWLHAHYSHILGFPDFWAAGAARAAE